MRKIIGIVIMTLLIATAGITAVETINEFESHRTTLYHSQDPCDITRYSQGSLHDIEIEWERLYGGSNGEVFRNVKQTSDGGYIMVGVWNGESHWLFKVDENGDEEWSATALPHTDEYWPRCYHVEQTSDGGYITTGSHEDEVYLGHDRCIWKVDADGNTEFLKTYDDPLYGWHMCIKETEDGGYIVCGEADVDENNPADFDVLLFKTDAAGNIEWQQIWRYNENGAVAYAVRQTPDGGYILSGRVESNAGDSDFLIIKTDANGNKEWEKTYGGDNWEQTQSSEILFTDDGGYLFLASTRSSGSGRLDLWLIKTDGNGNMEWSQTFGGKFTDMGGGLDYTDDGKILISGTLDADNFFSPTKSQGLVIKTDSNGKLEWQYDLGYDDQDQLQGIRSTNDGGYIVAGNTLSTSTHGSGDWDAWLVKIKAFDNDPPDKPAKPSGPSKGKPDTEYTFTTTPATDPDGDQVSYRWDWGDGNFTEGTIEESYTWAAKGNFEVRVKTVDEFGAESDWSDPLPFRTPKSKQLNQIGLLIERLIERFPVIEYLIS